MAVNLGQITPTLYGELDKNSSVFRLTNYQEFLMRAHGYHMLCKCILNSSDEILRKKSPADFPQGVR